MVDKPIKTKRDRQTIKTVHYEISLVQRQFYTSILSYKQTSANNQTFT